MSFIVGYAKLGTSSCKKCKVKIDKTGLRIGKVTPNPFSEGAGDMKQWFHPHCIFETFTKARATTKVVEEAEDLDGFSEIKDEDKEHINSLIDDCMSKRKNKPAPKTKKSTDTSSAGKKHESPPNSTVGVSQASKVTPTVKSEADDTVAKKDNSVGAVKDNSMRNFRKLCADIAAVNSHLEKTKIVSNYLTKGSGGDGFHGDTYLLLKLLLPGVIKSVYNLNSKQLVKHFSQIFGTDLDEMVEHLNNGDVAETIQVFFEKSTKLPCSSKSVLSIQQVDHLLEELSEMTKDDDQIRVLRKIAQQCTGNDMKTVVRLIKHDLRINSGAKHILDALDDNAYAAFQTSRDLRDVVDRVLANRSAAGGKFGMCKALSIKATVMTPVLPMLAEACRSVEYAMKKCPNGFYAEIKYDGERVQLHKNGLDFQYFSRSLKPVLNHKVHHFKDYIPQAFPTGNNLILDSEVLLVDTNTSTPLPFGTLGVHKKAAFKDANVCLFVFDCLHINGENLMHKPIKERRRILSENMTEIKNRVMVSQFQHITHPDDLQDMMTKVFREGLEGLVLKDVNSMYEPGKRHWLKVKKDYLHQGSMADSADLILLGAYYGTGNKGGMMSVFLMGVYDPATKRFCTVTKVSGIDDRTLDNLNRDLDMVKTSKDMSRLPAWINLKKGLVPDFVVADPKKSPVWEIAGAEFSQSDIHTADGISIRFPRIAKVRDDKTWQTATDLPRLKLLFEKSKDTSDFPDMSKKLGKWAKSEVKEEVGEDESNGKRSDGVDQVKIEPRHSTTPVKRKMHSDPVCSPPKQLLLEKSKDTSDFLDTSKKLGKWAKSEVKEEVGEDESNGKRSDGVDQVKIEPRHSTTPVKRKMHSDPSCSPAKQTKEVCKYGTTCYQTSDDHLDRYHHSSHHSFPSPNKVFPNVFQGTKFYIPVSATDYIQLRRYIITYGGDVLTETEKHSATHVVSDSQTQSDLSGQTVVSTPSLWQCIKDKCMLPDRNNTR